MKENQQILKFEELKKYLFSLQFFILFSTLIFIMGVASGIYLPRVLEMESKKFIDILRKNIESLSQLNKFSQFFLILFNNSFVSFLIILFGIFFGIIPFFILIGNGELFGMLYFFLKGDLSLFLKSLLPHGIIELPVIIISSSIGFKLGKISFLKVLRKKVEIKKEISKGLEFFLKILFPLLIIASFFEVFITPLFLKF